MKHLIRLCASITFGLVLIMNLNAQQNENAKPMISGIDVSGQWFLAYQNYYRGSNHENQFILRRGYVTFSKKFTDAISVRFTQDITTDVEGGDAGNIEMRLKYLYIKIKPQNCELLRYSSLEFGMVHRPWIDFEEKINRFRVQGKMYAERVHLMNSADFGATFTTLLGGEIDKDYQKNVSKHFPGRYGSLVFGVYNGGGYHALEENNNKTFEGRLTLRPLPDNLPGLQASYGTAIGKGNISSSPDWTMHQAAITYESSRFRAVGQYVTGEGNSYGSFVDVMQEALPINGYSLFAEAYLLKDISVMGRMDAFTIEKEDGDAEEQRIIGGICYHFLNGQKVLLNMDYFDEDGTIERIYEIALEIRF